MAREHPAGLGHSPDELARYASSLPPVLTVDEVARLLRVNRKTLYESVRLGHVPGVVRMGRTIRIGRDALLEWLRGNGSPALGDDR